jgi:DNA-binding response OmpR family regulator
MELPRVLLIEDDPALTRALHDYLSYSGFRVTTALNADADADVDVIISDYRLPGSLTGTEAIAALRARAGRETPAILLTGDIRGDATHAAAQMNAVKLMLKPVRMEALVNEIRALLTAP